MIANPFNSIIITFPGFKSVHPLIIWMKKAPRSYCFIILKQVLSSGQVGCRRSSILQVSMSEIDLPSTPSDEVISQTQSFSIFDVSQLFIFALQIAKFIIPYLFVLNENNPESVRKSSSKSKSFRAWYHHKSFGILFHVPIFQNCILIGWWRSNFYRISLWDFKNSP